MKKVLLLASGVVVSAVFLQIVEGAPLSNLSTTTQTSNVPSIRAARTMIVGEWDNSVGPNPFTTRITQNTLWNSLCWSRYKILGVGSRKISEGDAYLVEVEFTSTGGPGDCGQSSKPSFSIALIFAGDVLSGKATSIFWLDCESEKDFHEALQYQDPRHSNAACSRYVSDRDDHR